MTELLNKYIMGMKRYKGGMSEKTIETYTHRVELFFNSCNKNPLEVTKEDIINYLDNNDFASATKHLIASALSSFYKILKNENVNGFDTYNPTEDIEMYLPKVKNKVKIPLNREQIRAILNVCPNVRDKAFWTMMFTTGLRISEAIELTLEQYLNRTDNNEIIITGKGDKDRIIALNDETVEAIENYLPKRKECEYDNLFISNGGTPLLRTSCSRTLKNLARKTGRFTDYQIKNMCNHLTRASYATNLLDSEVPIEMVKDILGHESIQTTLIYAKRNQKMAMNTMRNFTI